MTNSTSWAEVLSSIADKVRTFAPASDAELAALHASGQVPMELNELLSMTNGIRQVLVVNGEAFEDLWLVWPVADLLASRAGSRHAEWTFARAGVDSITFCVDVDIGRVSAHYPMEDRVEVIADSLRAFVVGWQNGSIHL